MKKIKELPLKQQIIIYSSIGLILFGLSLLTSNSENNKLTNSKAKMCAENYYNTTGKSEYNTIKETACNKAKYSSERYKNIKYCYLALYGPSEMSYYVAYDTQTSKTVVLTVLLDKFVYKAECDKNNNINE